MVGFALATAYVLPLVRLAEAGIATWTAMLVVGAIGVPLVFALVTIFLGRTGPLKDWLIRVLCTTSVGVAFGVVVSSFATAAATWIRRGPPSDLRSLAPVAVLGLPVILFGLILTRLLRGTVSAWVRWPAAERECGGSRNVPPPGSGFMSKRTRPRPIREWSPIHTRRMTIGLGTRAGCETSVPRTGELI